LKKEEKNRTQKLISSHQKRKILIVNLFILFLKLNSVNFSLIYLILFKENMNKSFSIPQYQKLDTFISQYKLQKINEELLPSFGTSKI